MSQPPDDATVAWFSSLEEVRAVEIDLERHGVDSVHVVLPEVDSRPDRRAIDRRTGNWALSKFVVGAVVGAVIGAVIGLLLGLWLMDTGSEVALFAMGGAIFGVAPGFFYGVATRLPAEPETFDTFADDSKGTSWIAVSGPEDVRRSAADVIRSHGPTNLTGA